MPRPLQVFLCHASQDKPEVWKLHRYLKGRGVKPWLDQADLMPGQNWEIEIPKALFASDVILVCLSKNSVNKEGYVQKEIAFALDKALEKPEGTIFIIPVKLEECEIPNRLSRYQWVNYYRPDGRKRLLMGLNLRVADLGEEVSPIFIEETKQRMPKPLKEVKQEEPVNLLSSKEKVEKESKVEPQITPSLQNDETTKENLGIGVDKEIQKAEPIVESFHLPQDKTASDEIKPKTAVEKKPYTKILNPSSLNPLQPKENKQSAKKSLPNNIRWFVIGLIFILFAGNYIGQNWFNPQSELPTVTSTDSSIPTITSVPPTFTSDFGIGSTVDSDKDSMTLLFVPAGEFTMGNNDGDNDEQPVHQVNLDSYWIDQTEITNKQYEMCVKANACDKPLKTKSFKQDDYYENPQFGNYPVIYVNWHMAKAYCAWAGRRLPTEAEWEKAAHDVNQGTYPWGDESPSKGRLNYNQNVGDTTEVGKYPASKSIYGAYDMAGNVWEWVNDLYQQDYYGISPYSDPKGPNLLNGKFRVLRGGSWESSDDIVRSANRHWFEPTLNNVYTGFRCAMDGE